MSLSHSSDREHAELRPASPGAPQPRAVLWDLDGTLVDSGAYHWHAWESVMSEEGVHITELDFKATFGQRNDTILGAWLGPDADPERVQRVGEAKEARYRALLVEGGITPLPGAAEWVASLHAAGWRQAIASSAPKLNVETVSGALAFTDLIEAVVGAEDVTAGKPDPEVFLTAAARLDVPPKRCVVVEDAEAGIEAARRAGMRTIGVGSGAVQAADLVIPSLADLSKDAFDRLVAPPASGPVKRPT